MKKKIPLDRKSHDKKKGQTKRGQLEEAVVVQFGTRAHRWFGKPTHSHLCVRNTSPFSVDLKKPQGWREVVLDYGEGGEIVFYGLQVALTNGEHTNFFDTGFQDGGNS